MSAPLPTASRRGRALEIAVSSAPPGFQASIIAAARETLGSEGYTHGSLHVAIIGDAEMKRQHARWMNDPTTTDVLTFDLRDVPRTGYVDGELLVCSGEARRQAKRRGGDWKTELLLYVVHGCLHLCGYDDAIASEAARMHQIEDGILTRLGWGAVYASQAAKPQRKLAKRKKSAATSVGRRPTTKPQSSRRPVRSRKRS